MAVDEIASQVAQSLAPRATGYRDCRLRQPPFLFAGQRAFRREINWIYRSRNVVKKVLDNDPAFVATSERQTIWSLWVVWLRENLR